MKKYFVSLFFAAFFAALGALGAYLAKLFLRPIRDEIGKFDRFIADSAHELNTPLSALLLVADSLKNSCSDEKNLSRLKITARSIATIYDDLAFFAKKGEVESYDEEIEMAGLVTQRVEMMREMAELKNIIIDSEMKPFVCKIDRSKASKLIDNLLSNAIKYSPKDTRVCVSSVMSHLRIEDSGSGIPKDMEKKVFDRNFRLDNKQFGSGIGLAIVRKICEEYKIDIAIDSSQALGGAKFSLNFINIITKGQTNGRVDR